MGEEPGMDEEQEEEEDEEEERERDGCEPQSKDSLLPERRSRRLKSEVNDDIAEILKDLYSTTWWAIIRH